MMRDTMVRGFSIFAACAAAQFVAGCSGGGGNASVSPPVTASSTPGTQSKVAGSITIVVPARTSAKRRPMHARAPRYVSPGTLGLFATFVDATDTTTYQGYTLGAGVAQTTASPASCGAARADGSFTCTLAFDFAPAASPYTITLTAYDSGQSGTGSTPAGGNALSTDTEVETVASNDANAFAFTLEGIVEGFSVSAQYVGVDGTVPATLSSTFAALDSQQYVIGAVDTKTNFAVGPQSGGGFVENASFDVGTLDEGTCTSGAPCVTTSAAPIANPASQTVAYAYSGAGSPGDGSTVQPYYGVVTVGEPRGYTGFTSASLGSPAVAYAGAVYVVPLFGLVDPTSPYADATSNSTVDFTLDGTTESITGYAAQYAQPTNATGGYTADASSCANQGSPLATVSSPSPNPGYGASFTITAGTSAGSCTITVGDGAGDTASIAVNVTSSSATTTVPSPGPTYSPNVKKRR